MIISIYSCLTALLWFVIFLAAGDFLRRKTGFLGHYNFYTLLLLFALSVARLLLPIELPFTKVIRSQVILPALKTVLFDPFMNVMGLQISLITLILLIWSIVALYKLIKLFRRILRDRSALKTISPVEDEQISLYLKDIASKTKPNLKYRIIVSPDIHTPMLTGLINPTILLPQSEADENTLRLFVLHEWQHILNKDQWIKLVISMIGCVMWWLPAAKRLENHAEDALELRCDLSLTQKMTDFEKSSYLRALITAYDSAVQAQEAKSYFSFAARLASSKSTNEAVKERFEVIRRHKDGIRFSRAAFFAIACVLFALSFLFVVQPYYSVPQEAYTEDAIKISAETAYIVETNGHYALYYNGVYACDILEDSLNDAPFNQLKIIHVE